MFRDILGSFWNIFLNLNGCDEDPHKEDGRAIERWSAMVVEVKNIKEKEKRNWTINVVQIKDGKFEIDKDGTTDNYGDTLHVAFDAASGNAGKLIIEEKVQTKGFAWNRLALEDWQWDQATDSITEESQFGTGHSSEPWWKDGRYSRDIPDPGFDYDEIKAFAEQNKGRKAYDEQAGIEYPPYRERISQKVTSRMALADTEYNTNYITQISGDSGNSNFKIGSVGAKGNWKYRRHNEWRTPKTPEQEFAVTEDYSTPFRSKATALAEPPVFPFRGRNAKYIYQTYNSFTFDFIQSSTRIGYVYLNHSEHGLAGFDREVQTKENELPSTLGPRGPFQKKVKVCYPLALTRIRREDEWKMTEYKKFYNQGTSGAYMEWRQKPGRYARYYNNTRRVLIDKTYILNEPDSKGWHARQRLSSAKPNQWYREFNLCTVDRRQDRTKCDPGTFMYHDHHPQYGALGTAKEGFWLYDPQSSDNYAGRYFNFNQDVCTLISHKRFTGLTVKVEKDGDGQFVECRAETRQHGGRTRTFKDKVWALHIKKEKVDELRQSGKTQLYIVLKGTVSSWSNEATLANIGQHIVFSRPVIITIVSNYNITGPEGIVKVFENTTFVHKFTANSDVNLSIYGGDDALKFKLDGSGNLSFREAPDYENPNSYNGNNDYQVIIRAVAKSKDGRPCAFLRDGACGIIAQITVNVEVVAVDEIPPLITGPSGGPGASNSAINVNENRTSVHQFDANEKVHWSISGGDDASKFQIDATRGLLSFKNPPDYENPTQSGDIDNDYVVIVQATDTSRLVSEQTVKVTVDNDNELPPLITGPDGDIVEVWENTTAVHTFTANEDVEWSISGADASKFSINTDGVLSFKIAPDYENPQDTDKNNDYVVAVKAVDIADLESEQTVKVTVVRAPPIITGPGDIKTQGQLPFDLSYTDSAINVNENRTSVHQFDANEKVTWSVVDANLSKFQINTDGVLSFKIAPDYENPTDRNKNNTYPVIIRARDIHNLVSYQTVTVTVVNVDDTPPIITGPGGVAGASESAVSVNVGAFTVWKFTANEDVTWSIDGGDDASAFSINAWRTGTRWYTVSGNLSFKAASKATGDNTYKVIVKATDTTGLASYQTVTVKIINNLNPIITSSEYGIDIDENSGPNALVYQITASIQGEYGEFTYALGGDDAAALTVNTSGDVTLNANPDYETKNSYTFTVTAIAKECYFFGYCALSSRTSAPKTVTFSIINVVEAIKIIGIDASGADLLNCPEDKFGIVPETFRGRCVNSHGDSIVKIPEDKQTVGTFRVEYVDGRKIDNSDVTWSKSDSPEDRYFYEINKDISGNGVLSFVQQPNIMLANLPAVRERFRTMIGSVMSIIATVKDGEDVVTAMHTIRIQTIAV